MTTILIVLILLHFFHEQFEFSSINRLGYWIIPILTGYEFLQSFSWSWLNASLLVGILGFASLVSWYQAKHTKIRLEETATTYFRDDQQHEVPIYRKDVTAQGGRYYLYGWLVVIVVQLLIEALYLHENLTPHKVWEDFFEEVMADVFSFYRFTRAGAPTSWILWALTASTSLGYTLWLARRSPAARRTLFGHTKYRRVTDEEN